MKLLDAYMDGGTNRLSETLAYLNDTVRRDLIIGKIQDPVPGRLPFLYPGNGIRPADDGTACVIDDRPDLILILRLDLQHTWKNGICIHSAIHVTPAAGLPDRMEDAADDLFILEKLPEADHGIIVHQHISDIKNNCVNHGIQYAPIPFIRLVSKIF